MKASKAKQIESHLLAGKALTGIQALQLYGVYRLSSVINRLRGRHEIHTDMIDMGDVRYAKYYIPELYLF